MKTFLLTALILLAIGAHAQTLVTIDSGTTTTVPGIGGIAQLGYAFAKGDLITIDAKASKKLDRMLVYHYPDIVVGKVMFTKRPKFTFAMPEDGIIVFNFVSDRDGTNAISYTVTRMPASAAMQNYSTKITWQPSKDRSRQLIPTRVGSD